MKQNFLDKLDGGWGDIIADTYKKYNSIDTTMTFSTEEGYLVDDYLTPSTKENIKTFTIVNPVLEILIKDEYVQRSFSSNKAGDLTIGIKDYDYIDVTFGNNGGSARIPKSDTYKLKYNNSGIHMYVQLSPNVIGSMKFFECWRELGDVETDVETNQEPYVQLESHNMYMEKYDPKLDEALCKDTLKEGDIIGGK